MIKRRRFMQACALAAQALPRVSIAGPAGATDAAAFGFSPDASGVDNARALQAAVDVGGDIVVSRPGVYKLAATVTIGDNTALLFGAGVVVQKVAEQGAYCHVFINKGAFTRRYNHNIAITGLTLEVNGVEVAWLDDPYGLRGQLAFFYAKDVRIERLRCLDLGSRQFCVHVCTFEDLLVNDIVIRGRKDGVHLGPGRRYRISNAVFQTADDAIALAPGDWVTGNPELGDLDDGVIENCHELEMERSDGAFCKIVASAWLDWKQGMQLRHGDTVVSNGALYRVVATVDGKFHTSLERPDFGAGSRVVGGIRWVYFGKGEFHTAVVRNVVFRDIVLESSRVPFQIMCYAVDYAHSYYSGAPMPVQGPIAFDHITVANNFGRPLAAISTALDVLAIRNSSLRNNAVAFSHAADVAAYPPTHVSFSNCTFGGAGDMTLVDNTSKGKEVFVKTGGSVVTGAQLRARVAAGPGIIHVDSDLPGLQH